MSREQREPQENRAFDATCDRGSQQQSAQENERALSQMALVVDGGELEQDAEQAVLAGLRDTPDLSYSEIAPEVLDKLLPDEYVELPRVRRVAGGLGYRFVKRTFDVVACSAALVVLAIPIGVIAVMVKRESPGPAFYAQTREGKDGKPFKLYKFRSMYTDAESRGAQWAVDDDPRVTPLGKKLRNSRLASVIIGTPGDGESTKSLSRSANSSLDLQLCECRPGLCSTCNSHYKPFEFLSLGIFGGVPSLSRNLVGCNGFSPSEESAIRFSFLGFGKDGACAAW